MLYPAHTSCFKKSATSFETLPSSIRRSIVIGSFGKRRIVMIGPLTATGGSTIFTRSPFSSLASVIGIASLTMRLHFPAICCTTSSSFVFETKRCSQQRILPSLSTKMPSVPFTMISVTLSSSRSSCKISSRRIPLNSCCLSVIFSDSGIYCPFASSQISLSISTRISSSDISSV